jgi:hypothetical protein
MPQRNERVPGRFVALAVLAALAGLLAPPARAADADKLDNTSLRLIPADASFYGTLLRNREQIEAIANSRAWAKLRDLPAAKMLWQKVREEYTKDSGGLAPLRHFYEQPENKELVEVLADAVSNEVFFYGGKGWPEFVDLASQINGAVRFGPMMAQLSGKGRGKNPNQLQAQMALETLAENLDLIQIPEFVIGFKISDTKKAEAQLQRLQALGEALVEHAPPLKGQFKRVKVGTDNFLTLTLDGSMVPWDQIPFDSLEEKEGQFAPLVKKLRGLKLTVSLGVRDGYLLVSLAPSTDAVTRLGAKGPRLLDRAELKPLAKFADKRLTAISYASQTFIARASTSGKDIEGMIEGAKSLLAKADLTDEQRKRLDKDLDDLAKDLKKYVPEVGAALAFSFLTERGQEGYAYDFGKHPEMEGAKPLTLLNHVGGNPILAAVGWSRPSTEGYETLVKWVRTAYGHAEEAFLPKLPADQKDKYEEFKKTFFPLLGRLNEATGKMLLPSLDGQAAFVLDAKWTSKQWIKLLPETPQALPLPELGIVLGVRNAALLRKAMGEYRQVLNEIIAKVHDLDPTGNVPDIKKIPEPETAKTNAGTLYFYTLPAEWGLDPQVLPTAGLSAQVAALGLSRAHAERLLSAKPLKVDGGPLADYAKRPLVGAFYCNWPAFIDAVTPWAQYAADQVPGGKDGDGPTWGDLVKQTRTVLEVLKVFRGTTSATYLENGVLVTHTETVIRDL